MAVVDSKGNPVRDSSGNPVRSGNAAAAAGNPRAKASFDSQSRSGQNPLSSISNTIGSEFTRIGNEIKSGVEEFISDTGFGKLLRAANLLEDAIPEAFDFRGNVTFQDRASEPDWRVRLSLPTNFKSSNILAPIQETNGLVWPYTPQIFVTHSAGYTPVKPVHSNYPFFAYQNSQVDQFAITGDFTVENSVEGAYWIAAVHYLRSITKMAYGNTDHQGSPPPVVRLNGYGDYVFKDVPVVIVNFSVELSQDVDYIKVPGLGAYGSYAPTRSNIQATVQPLYSRRAVEQFSLRKFVNGGHIGDGFI